MSEDSESIDLLPREPIDAIVAPIRRFLHIEATSGVLLVAATLAALTVQTVKTGVAWGQAVNDIEDMTGMNSQSASRLLGVGRIVGIQNEEMVGLLAKLSKTVNTANNAVTISGVVKDNAAGSSALVKDGSNTLTLSVANTYSGGTTKRYWASM